MSKTRKKRTRGKGKPRWLFPEAETKSLWIEVRVNAGREGWEARVVFPDSDTFYTGDRFYRSPGKAIEAVGRSVDEQLSAEAFEACSGPRDAWDSSEPKLDTPREPKTA